MSFQPIVVGTGLVAWRNLQRSLSQQLETFTNTAEQKRLVTRFETKAPELTSAEAVVSDRQVLALALGAYGLQDDLDNRFFVKRILSEGASEPDALANRLTDRRYRRLASDFALDGSSQFTGVLPGTAKQISTDYVRQACSIAVGQQDQSLRLALNAASEFERISDLDVSDNAKWFLLMGNPPLRRVVETALGLPESFGQLDIDRQLDVFQGRSFSSFNAKSFGDLASKEVRDKVVDSFLLREQMSQAQSVSSENIALQLLSFGR
ncbi:DUF1217 domain-containing protein [Planktotalea sp.]|uniref:DUF1217 domain-containing protein n=1 Tax=Planktotalea sp. TaxID=2029877 RepID=UPI003F6B1265